MGFRRGEGLGLRLSIRRCSVCGYGLWFEDSGVGIENKNKDKGLRFGVWMFRLGGLRFELMMTVRIQG